MRIGLLSWIVVVVSVVPVSAEACGRCSPMLTGVRCSSSQEMGNGAFRRSPYATHPLQYQHAWQPRPVVDPSFRPPQQVPPAKGAPVAPVAPGGPVQKAPVSQPAPAVPYPPGSQPAPGVSHEPGGVRVGPNLVRTGRPIETDHVLEALRKGLQRDDDRLPVDLRQVRDMLKTLAPYVQKLEAKQALNPDETARFNETLRGLSRIAMTWFGPRLSGKNRDERRLIVRSLEQHLANAQAAKTTQPQDGAVYLFLRGFAKSVLEVDGERLPHTGLVGERARPIAMREYQDWLVARGEAVTVPAPTAAPVAPTVPAPRVPTPTTPAPTTPAPTTPPPTGTFRF